MASSSASAPRSSTSKASPTARSPPTPTASTSPSPSRPAATSQHILSIGLQLHPRLPRAAHVVAGPGRGGGPQDLHRRPLAQVRDLHQGRSRRGSRPQRRARSRPRSAATIPAIFAISVVNEIPADVVRFMGHRRRRGVHRRTDRHRPRPKRPTAWSPSPTTPRPNSSTRATPTSSASTSTCTMTRSCATTSPACRASPRTSR